MTDERELDRAIETAASTMMAREPGRALTHTVMARVRHGVKPSSYRLVWVTAAASVLLCATIAAVVMSRVPQTLPPLPVAQRFAVAQPPTIAEPPIVPENDMRPARRINSAPVAVERRAAAATALPADVSPLEPIAPEAIAMAAIEVPRLEPQAPILIEALDIDELTIEPLAASND